MELFVFDIDGTLVERDGELTELDRSEMNYQLSRGNAICMASGRPVTGVKRYMSELIDSPLKFVAAANGSELETYSGERIMDLGITYADYLRVRQVCAAPHRVVYIYRGSTLGSHDRSWVLDAEFEWNRMERRMDFNEEPLSPEDTIAKVVVCSDPDDSAELEKKLGPEPFEGLRMVRTAPFFLEFVNPEVDKSSAVRHLEDRLSLTPDRIHTFGDEMNDFRMIRDYDGTAMGNALDEVKRVAERVTLTVEEDGVGVCLRDVFHGE